uniref:Coiled-coil domain-containing protein 84-like n=1 Tax=Sinocyclocheilus rhinocerous TaxID=307959 RepID=A0A673IUA9_9TELE
MGAFYCSVCRKTDFSGKGHIYGKSHQSKLKVILVKFTEKVKEARRTIKNPQVEKYSPHHEEKFWCYCCALEVQKHVTDSNISVLYGGLLEHMSTPEHRKNTHKFWWDNKAEPKLRDKFIITEEETERFKSEVSKALEQFEEKEDVLIKQQAAVIRSQEQHRLEVLQSLSEPDPELVQPAEVDQHSSKHAASSHSRSYEAEAQPGPSHEDFASHSQWNEPELGLTFIGYQKSKRSSRSFRPTAWVQTLTTAHILMPTGCHLLDVCGIVAGAGSLGISSEKRRQKLGERGRGKMMGKQQRSKKTSVMETYEMDAPNILAVWERWCTYWFSHIENYYLKAKTCFNLTPVLNISCFSLCISKTVVMKDLYKK